MEKNAMRREGHQREAVFIKGEWRDWLQYAILDWEWIAAQVG
jgi:RimJ/RimL family protein N-acetyltransferase